MTDTLLRFIHISDTHINPDPTYTGEHGEYSTLAGARALVEQVNALPFDVDFVLHTGDVVFNPEPEAYAIAQEILGQLRFPVYYLAGNHDHAGTLQQAMMGREEIRDPLDYEFEVNGVQIVCLDSNGPAEPPRGLVLPEQIDWLAERCAADDRPLVVAIHHNVLPVEVPWLDDFMRIINGEAVHRALLPARERIRGVFFGHVHQNVEMLRDGILYTSTLSSWVQYHAWPGMDETHQDVSAEPGFNVVTLTRDQTYLRRYRFPKP
jgi:3',5'-cyclic-AMP phosphodiesterase